MSKFLMNDVVKQCCKFKFYIWLTSCVIYIYCLIVIKIFDADLDYWEWDCIDYKLLISP